MKHYVSFAALFSVLAMATPLSISAFADEAATSSAIAHYIQNARTQENRESIAAHFDSEAAQATAIADTIHGVQLRSLKNNRTSEERYAVRRGYREATLPETAQALSEQGRGKPRACPVPSRGRQLLTFDRPVFVGLRSQDGRSCGLCGLPKNRGSLILS